MASEPEKTNEVLEKEVKDSSDEEKNERNVEIEMVSTNPKQKDRKSTPTIPKREDRKSTPTSPKREDKKRPKVCDEDPYIVKLFKSLMNPEESQRGEEKKK